MKYLVYSEKQLTMALNDRIAHASATAKSLIVEAEKHPSEMPRAPNGLPQKTRRSELEAMAAAWMFDEYDAQNWLRSLSVSGVTEHSLTFNQARWLFKHLAPPRVQAMIGELPDDDEK